MRVTVRVTPSPRSPCAMRPRVGSGGTLGAAGSPLRACSLPSGVYGCKGVVHERRHLLVAGTPEPGPCCPGPLNDGLDRPRRGQQPARPAQAKEFAVRAQGSGGCGQHFEGGSVNWSPATGAQVTVRAATWALGPVRAWRRARWGLSRRRHDLLSGRGAGSRSRGPSSRGRRVRARARCRAASASPTPPPAEVPDPSVRRPQDQVCGLNRGGCGQHFQGGSLFWSPTDGAHAMYGAIRDR